MHGPMRTDPFDTVTVAPTPFVRPAAVDLEAVNRIGSVLRVLGDDL